MPRLNTFRSDYDLSFGISTYTTGYQCSEPSSPSVLEVGPDGGPAVVSPFSSRWTDYGKWGWDRTPYGAPLNFRISRSLKLMS